jgi:hypothetical protein
MQTFSKQLRFLLCLLVILAFTQIVNAQVGKLYPVDEAAKDPSFFAFRARLLKAIHKKDASFLLSIVDPKIANNFGGDDGLTQFKRIWHPERPTSPVWTELLAVLVLGGKFDKDQSFAAPYLFNSFPEQFDAFEHGAVIEDGVRVRREPNTRGTVIRTLSFDIVKLGGGVNRRNPGEKREWVLVELTDGQRGYVASEYIRSPIDYRAIFEKKNGKWIMTAFIAGD